MISSDIPLVDAEHSSNVGWIVFEELKLRTFRQCPVSSINHTLF